MFSKILIANRGEIACRVIRSARRMGVRTVAVYSDADRAALHVEMADEAVHIGPSPSSESYLKGDAIIEAAKRTGAESIHPGYGFLSENPDFVEAVERAGLVFIGPSAKAIRAMGLKDAAKQVMEKAKVPVVPGYHGDAQDLVILAGKANEIGFPVLIKARAGGGGKGMRKVDRQADFADALSSARREARSSFGDDRVLVEKWIDTPRHIEVQVFGDNHGNVVHLFERDCSLQRRHQKVIEEAPAPGMTDEMRSAMGDAAVKAAQAIGYSGAGTVEFIVDASKGLRPDRFWFMEMNTRLQVEHPVTEMITGVDLVEWQLRVASGETVPKRQSELTIDGWAFEARLYAEDPARNFMPATGRIAHLSFATDGARIESGVRTGDEITAYYDPMIAKIVTHGADRAAALGRMRAAIAATEIAGTTTNLGFLGALCRHPDFVKGEMDTTLIDRDLTSLAAGDAHSDLSIAVAGLAVSGMQYEGRPASIADPFALIGPWQHWAAPSRTVALGKQPATASLTVTREGPSTWRVRLPSGRMLAFDLVVDQTAGLWRIDHGGHRRPVRVVRYPGGVSLFFDGKSHHFDVPVAIFGADSEMASGDGVSATMPGLVKQILKRPGDLVARGEALVIMEAMKMEMTLTAPRDGVIADIPVEEGAQVADGTLLVVLEADEVAA